MSQSLEIIELNKEIEALLLNQCNTVTNRVRFVPGGMGPDTVEVSMVTGQVLQIGLEGVCVFETRGALEAGFEPLKGVSFHER